MTKTTRWRTVVNGRLIALVVAALPPMLRGQQLPPIRRLGEVVHTSKESFGAVSQIRLLANGQLLVNDMVSHRLVMLDSSLALHEIVADSNLKAGRQYPNQPAGLIPFSGDSTLFVDPASLSIVVLDADGRFTRVMGWSQAADMRLLLGGPNGFPGLDGSNHIVYRGRPSFASLTQLPGDSVRKFANRELDSVALLRMDLQTRRLDTAAFSRFYKDEPAESIDRNGLRVTASALDPLPAVDGWVVMTNGALAIVRVQDYHVDWVSASTTRSTAKIPHEWKQLSDSAKVAIVDSARAAALRTVGLASRLGVPAASVGESTTGSSGDTHFIVHGRTAGLSSRPPSTVNDSAHRAGEIQFIRAAELPDYAPPFLRGGVLAGGDGNLWVRNTIAALDGPVYDVVSPDGQLLQRVSIPAGRVISAVTRAGIVYTSFREASTVRIEARRLVP